MFGYLSEINKESIQSKTELEVLFTNIASSRSLKQLELLAKKKQLLGKVQKRSETNLLSTWFSRATNVRLWASELWASNEDKEESSESKSNYDMLVKSYELYTLFTTELDQIKYLKKIMDHLQEFSNSL